MYACRKSNNTRFNGLCVNGCSMITSPSRLLETNEVHFPDSLQQNYAKGQTWCHLALSIHLQWRDCSTNFWSLARRSTMALGRWMFEDQYMKWWQNDDQVQVPSSKAYQVRERDMEPRWELSWLHPSIPHYPQSCMWCKILGSHIDVYVTPPAETRTNSTGIFLRRRPMLNKA